MADKYTEAEVKALGAKGHAFKNPDGSHSYPISDAEDLGNAIKAVGRGGADHDAIRKYITGRAKALGLSSQIPDTWNADGSLKGSSSQLAPLELRRRRRGSMTGKLERRQMPFARGGIELRGVANGTGGSDYVFTGYGSVFDSPFDMWDSWGDPYTEIVRPGAFTRSLSRADLDVPFLIGHNDAGIPLARTRSGTMTLGEDSRGLHVEARMDGRSSLVRDLASAVERGDMDEMSIGFITDPGGQQWSQDWMTREMLSMDVHRGDVSAVALAAAPATKGSTMTAMPGVANWSASWEPGAEQRAADEIIDNGGPPDSNIAANGLDAVKCPYTAANGCGVMNPGGNKFCGGCGGPLYSSDGTLVLDDSGVIEAEESGADAHLLSMRLRLLELT